MVEKNYDNVVYQNKNYRVNVIPTGSLDLDYALGTGGWSMGTYNGIFGPRDIGKSSMLGFEAIKNAQTLGLNCVFIDVEGEFEEEWAAKRGVDVSPEGLLVVQPDDGEDAFDLLYDCVHSGADLVIFDSLGAILSRKELEDDGKAKVAGQSGLITYGMKKCKMAIQKNNVCVLMLNQIRDNLNSPYAGSVIQPGGKTVEFLESVIVQLKKGKQEYYHPDDKKVVMGRQVTATVTRSKRRQGHGQVAIIDYYGMEVEGYPFGIDRVSDAISTGKRVGVIQQAGAFYTLPDQSRHQGSKAVAEYLEQNPTVYDTIRLGVLDAIVTQGGKLELEEV